MYHTIVSFLLFSSVAILSQAKDIYDGEPFCNWPTYSYDLGPATWEDRCGSGYNGNPSVAGLQCTCVGGSLTCPGNADGQPSDIEYCKMYCTCDEPQEGMPLNTAYQPPATIQQPSNNPPDSPWESTGNQAVCSGSCKNLDACPKGCACKADSIWDYFWFTGSCASVALPIFSSSITHGGLRRTKDKRQITISNSTSSVIPARPGPSGLPGASVKEAVPCNDSYVSLACAGAPDGIVHEAIELWLGKLLPDGADPKNPPPVDPEWLTAHNEIQSDPNMVQ